MAIAKTKWFGGGPNGRLGVCDISVKRVVDGAWDDPANWRKLGKTDHVNFNETYAWGDLKSNQTGEDIMNAQLIGQSTNAEVGLVELYAEVFEFIWPGGVVKRDLSSNVTRVYSKKMFGYMLTDLLLWVKFTQYERGVPSTDPLMTIYSLMAPRLESGEINSDLSQQIITLPFKGFIASEDYVTPAVFDADDPDKTPLSFWTAEDEY